MFFKEENLCAAPLYMHAVPSTSFLHDTYNIYLAMISYIFSLNYFSLSIERECSIPQMENNLDANPKKDRYKFGDVLKFSCIQGLIMVGADSIQCYHFGWSPNLPTCKGKYLSYSC